MMVVVSEVFRIQTCGSQEIRVLLSYSDPDINLPLRGSRKGRREEPLSGNLEPLLLSGAVYPPHVLKQVDWKGASVLAVAGSIRAGNGMINNLGNAENGLLHTLRVAPHLESMVDSNLIPTFHHGRGRPKTGSLRL